MKRNILAVFIVCLMAVPNLAMSIEMKIGVVDLQSILNDSRKGKEAIKLLEGEFENKKKEIDDKEKELQSLQDEMTKRAAFWSDKIKGEKEEDFNKKLKDFRRLQTDIKDEFERKNKSYTDKILADIIDLVKQVGKRDGYNLIMEKQTAIFVSDTVDITSRVVDLYDGVSTPSGTITPSNAPAGK